MGQLSTYEKSEIKALRLEDQDWILELERLVTAGNGIFHAVTEEIHGPEEIANVLEHLLGRGDLAEQTRAIVAEGANNAPRFYELVDDRWLLLPEGAFIDLRPTTRRNAADLAATLAALRALRNAALERSHRDAPSVTEDEGRPPHELRDSPARGAEGFEALTQTIDDLARRFERLEARLAALEAGTPRSPSAPPHSPPDGVKAKAETSTSDPLPPLAASPPQVTLPEDTPPPAAVDAIAPAAASDEAAAHDDEIVPPPIAALPDFDALLGTLEMLIGDEVPLAEGDPSSLPAKQVYLALFLDDDGATVGGVITDRAALVSLGGALLLLPQNTWKDALREGPSADILDAASEIVNNLTPLINQDERNVHIKSTPFKPLDGAPPAWTAHAERVAVDEGALGGKFLVLASPEPVLPPSA